LSLKRKQSKRKVTQEELLGPGSLLVNVKGVRDGLGLLHVCENNGLDTEYCGEDVNGSGYVVWKCEVMSEKGAGRGVLSEVAGECAWLLA
jgi:hypothetical protein